MSGDQLIGYAFVRSVVPSQIEEEALLSISSALGVQDQVLEGLNRVESNKHETVHPPGNRQFASSQRGPTLLSSPQALARRGGRVGCRRFVSLCGCVLYGDDAYGSCGP